MQRIDVIKSVARNLRDLIVDTVPASLTGTSIDATKLIHPLTGQLKGAEFYIYQGGGVGQQRVVTDFLPANNRLIFEEAFGTIPSINSSFILLKYFAKDEYDNALDRLIGNAKLQYLEDKVATLQIVASQYEYAVPSGFEYIGALKLVPSGSTDYSSDDEVDRIYTLASRYWSIHPNALGTFIIAFDPRKIDLEVIDKEWVNVIGQVQPFIGATDNATIPAPLEEYIVNGASMLLSSQRIDEAQEWRAKFQIFRDTHRTLEQYIYRSRYGKKVGN